MFWKIIYIIFLALTQIAYANPWDGFSQVKISDDCAGVLSKGDLVLENGGGKLIAMPDGSLWVIGVGSTAGKSPPSGAETMRQRKVSEQKARKAVLEELAATQVASKTTSNSNSIITTQNGVETGQSTEELRETIESKVDGIVRDLKLAGTWYSSDGQIFYMALCSRLR